MLQGFCSFVIARTSSDSFAFGTACPSARKSHLSFAWPGALTVSELLSRLDIDARRLAVEHNLVVLRRAAFAETVVHDGDQVEIVNFVGGG